MVSVAVPAMAYAKDSGAASPLESLVALFTGDNTENAEAPVEPYAAGDKGTDVADASTLDGWNAILESEGQATTQNIGRIWTDKSVFTDGASFTEGPLAGQEINVQGDHDFLVGLSALSSTSNTTTTTTITDPLDIVLIIDRSSSMNEEIATEVRYDEARNIVESHGHEQNIIIGTIAIQDSVGGEYYVQTGENEYARVQEATKRVNVGWTDTQYYYEHVRWELNGQEVDPATTTFYQKVPVATSSRMDALKEAAYNFVDSAADMPNSDLIRIGVVSFAGSSASDRNSSTVNSQLTLLTGNNDESIKDAISRIYAPGSGAGTYPEGAFDDASDLFRGSADNANKVIVFFTDGGPGGTTSSLLSPSVANDTVSAALPLKQSGVTIYSVGVLDGADPLKSIDGVGTDSPEIDQVNAFMHAVSSNYPSARGYTSGSLGDRAPDSDFYKVAGDAQELNQIFEDISHELPSSDTSGSPIEGTDQEGVQDAVPGTLTFTDPLGDYMEVTGDTMTLVYGDQQYTATKGADGVYSFPNQEVGGNDVYKSANLSQIKISIQKGTGSTGDTVTVSMPASFIPLRNYEVTTEDGRSTMSVSEAYPIRLFYGVSVRQDALDNLGDPGDTALQNYINSNKTDNGASVNFYANKWSGQQYGDATATFTPNEANKFYYYTENTELYVDEDCTQRATRWNINQYDTLYYKDTYWVQDGTTGTENTEVISVSRTGQDMQGLDYDRAGNSYIKAGTQRYDRPATLASNKANNETQTAGQALNPTWANNGTVSQRLGNNGVIPVELPAQLSITKTVGFGDDYGDAFDETVYTNKSYEMNIHVDGAQGTHKAQVKNAEGDVVSQPADGYFDITFDQNGNATHSIKADETLTIYGLDRGATYKVTENTTGLGNGFGTPDYTNNEGTLAANGTSNVTVANTYTLNPVIGKGEELFHGSKTLEGRDWENGTDVFTFQLAATGGAPMPAEAQGANSYQIFVDAPTDDASNSASFSFGDVTFTKPGVYTYTIEEIPPVNARPGMSYSNAAYTVEVTVADNQNGQMVVTSKMTQTRADNASDPAAGDVADKVAAFTNRFTESETTAVLGARKDYQNLSGNTAMDLKNGMFSVELRPTGANAADAPMPEGTTGDGADRVATGVNAGASMNFARIHFTNQMDGQTFTYEICEVQNTVDGVTNMTYDNAVYTVEITVHVDAQNRVSVDTEYFDADGNSLGTGEGGSATQPTFHNVYDPKDATLTEDTGSAIHGEKTLTGRDMKQDESFGFTLSPRGSAAQSAIASGDITIDGNDWTTLVSNGTNGQAKGFAFGNMTFKKAGTYRFAVQETSHNGEGLPGDGTAGMTYDRDVCIVTVAVTDDNGVLKAAVSYNNGTDQPSDRAVFQNTYTSSVDFGNTEGGIQITKQLDGRNLAPNEFQFEIKAVDAQGAVSADEADVKLTDADRTFGNPTGAMAGVPTAAWKQLAGLTFNQADAGKTFVYEVRETSQTTDTVTTDGTVYTVTLTPQDNGDGTMYVTGSVKGGGLNIIIDTRDENYAAPVLPFVNTYNPTSVSTSDDTDTTLQVTKKVTGADAAGAFEFELTLDVDASDNGADGVFEDTAATQAFDGMTATTKGNLAKDEEQTLSFGQLTFTKAGTYTFKVHETTQAPAAYWTYDNTEKTITVEVADHEGQLEILYAQGNNPTVENKYTAGAVVVGGDPTNEQITVKKTVTGNAFEGEISFRLEPVVEQGEGAKWQTVSFVDPSYDGLTTVDGRIDRDASATATFGGIKFSAAGEFKFKVTEVDGGADDPAGWTYDTHESFVTVTVTDDGQGQLEAKVAYDNTNAITDADKATTDAAAFTNSYAAEGKLEGETNLAVTKLLEGRTWNEDDSFTFELVAADTTTRNAITDGTIVLPENAKGLEITEQTENHTAAFGDVVFKSAGDYIFVVREVVPEDADPRMTYDTTGRNVAVKVSDEDNGALTVEVQASDGLTFTNTYVEPVAGESNPVNMSGVKVLEGGELLPGQFFFSITPLDGAPMGDSFESANPNGVGGLMANGIMLLKNVVYTAEDMDGQASKEFKYIITEEIPSEGSRIEGLTYDTSAYQVTVTVTLDKDANTYEAAVTSIERGVYEGDVFTADAQGAQIDQVVFTNRFAVDPVSITPLKVTKVLAGDRPTPLQGDEFSFELSIVSADPSDGVTLPEQTTVSNDADGAVQFGDITFTKAGAYTLKIEEKAPVKGEDGYDEHMTYSTNVLQSTFEVADTDQDGTLEVVRTTSSGDTTFVNTYNSQGDGDAKLEGAANLTVTKKLEGRTWNEDDGFTFMLVPHGAETQAAVDNGTVVLPDNAAGLVIFADSANHQDSFGDMTFKAEGTYYFDVVEQAGTDADMVYDTTPRLVVVKVDRAQAGGKLVATVDATSSASLSFTNVYVPGSKATVTAADFGLKKVFTGTEWDGDAFTFALSAADGKDPSGTSIIVPMPAEGRVTVTQPDAGSDDTATFGFGPITYTQAGTYVYEVRELAGDDESIRYSDNVAKVTVTVSTNGEGGLSAQVTVERGVFFNTYEAEFVTVGDDEADLQVTKEVTGAAAPSEFAFELKLENGDPTGIAGWSADGRTASTVGLVDKQAPATETVDFGDLVFTKAGDYTFTVTETTTTSDANWDYDNDPKTITVHVTDPGDGELEATVEGNNPTITNAYTEPSKPPVNPPHEDDPDPSNPSDPTDDDTDISKELSGRDLTAGEFSFQIATAEDYGDAVSPARLTATNAADGSVDFAGGFTFTKEGTYSFVISEVLPADDDPATDGVQSDGVTYDEATYRATATVTEVDGKLQVTWSVDGEIVFSNHYEEIEIPGKPDDTDKPGDEGDPDLPGTGDATLGMLAVVVAAGVGCLGAAHVLRKRGE